MTWTEIHKIFLKLKKITGADKSSSYVMNVYFDQEGDIHIELGTYDISDWPRSIELGPYRDEELAKYETLKKILEACEAVAKEYNVSIITASTNGHDFSIIAAKAKEALK